MTSDLDYLRQRECQARALADQAASPTIGRLHSDMAEHFLRKANLAAALSPPHLHVVRSADDDAAFSAQSQRRNR